MYIGYAYRYTSYSAENACSNERERERECALGEGNGRTAGERVNEMQLFRVLECIQARYTQSSALKYSYDTRLIFITMFAMKLLS